MNDDIKRKHGRTELVKGLLIESTTATDAHRLAHLIVQKLDEHDYNLIRPPSTPPTIGELDDDKAQRVVDKLIERPEVLYSVFRVIHNIQIAGPWEAKVHNNGTQTWHRIDARKGTAISSVLTMPGKGTRYQWTLQTGANAEGRLPGGFGEDLAEAMAAADVTLATKHGWMLTPGFRETP